MKSKIISAVLFSSVLLYSYFFVHRVNQNPVTNSTNYKIVGVETIVRNQATDSDKLCDNINEKPIKTGLNNNNNDLGIISPLENQNGNLGVSEIKDPFITEAEDIYENNLKNLNDLLNSNKILVRDDVFEQFDSKESNFYYPVSSFHRDLRVHYSIGFELGKSESDLRSDVEEIKKHYITTYSNYQFNIAESEKLYELIKEEVPLDLEKDKYVNLIRKILDRDYQNIDTMIDTTTLASLEVLIIDYIEKQRPILLDTFTKITQKDLNDIESQIINETKSEVDRLKKEAEEFFR